MALRIVIAVVLFVLLAGVAWWLERRRRQDAPTQASTAPPVQLDRGDFPHPEKPWLVVLFTSESCASCEGLYDKAAPLESSDVAVAEAEYTRQRAIHDRYKIAIAPLTLVADRDGVVRASFAGAFDAADLWNEVAALRQG
jgi:hypothetical protein